MKRNVFVLGLDAFNRAKLEALSLPEPCTFHNLLQPEDVDEPEEYDLRELMARAEAELAAFPGSVDAVVGYIDIPVGVMLPILCANFGLRSPSLKSVLKCQHKYWSRLIQAEVIPEHIPRFTSFDPFDPRALERIDFFYPFWIKPVKSGGSHLGFRINRPEDFHRALPLIRQAIPRLAEPYNQLMEYSDLPPAVAKVDAYHFLAESILTGRQCTLEGYVHNGEVHVYGMVDSIRHRNRTTFFRYQYPSSLPRRVHRKMVEVAGKVLRHIGLDHSPFNVEFFWRPRDDTVWLLEINTRISQSHAPLFEKVDGASNHLVMVETALGRRPELPRGQGAYRCAAKFYLRSFVDRVVTRVPDEKEIAALRAEIPGLEVLPTVAAGTRLSTLPEQDSYSYSMAYLFLGGENQADLLRKYRHCLERLRFEAEPVPVAEALQPALAL
jgi:hypothetical protein